MTKGFLAQVIEEAGHLGLPWWGRYAFILGVALLKIAGQRAWQALPKHLTPAEPTLPGPDVAYVSPASEWSSTVQHDGGPPGGGMGGG